jgi:biofilm PGA synthesis N-glycosyltransferase PgaC
VVITDADAKWSSSGTLSNAISWLRDPSAGSVTCLKLPADEGLAGVKESCREYHNIVRLAESKAHMTLVFHGELVAFKSGFPISLGANDSNTATGIALMGYRSIAVDSAPGALRQYSERATTSGGLEEHNTWCNTSQP